MFFSIFIFANLEFRPFFKKLMEMLLVCAKMTRPTENKREIFDDENLLS